MQKKLINKVSRRYLQGAAFIVLTGLVAGCSSGTIRFTDGLFTNSASSQQAVVNRPIPLSPVQEKQMPPVIQSGVIENNVLPPVQQEYENPQSVAQYPEQPVLSGKVVATGAPPRNLGTLPASVVQNSQVEPRISNRSYIVQRGDTLSAIARRNSVTVAELKTVNGLSSGAIRIGQKLSIPVYTSADAVVTQVSAPRTQTIKTQATNVQVNKPVVQTAAVVKTVSPASDTGQIIETVSVRMDESKSVEQRVVLSADSSSSKIAQARQDQEQQVQNAVASRDDSAVKAEPVAVVAPQATGISQMRWPVRGRILSSFGQHEGTTTNDGIDIMAPEGTSVRAAENGVVIYAGDGLKEFGNTVLIRHENNIVTVYGHNSKLLVKRNQQVRRGDEIAKSGMSGNATTPKVHFEVRKNSVPVNPAKFLENE